MIYNVKRCCVYRQEIEALSITSPGRVGPTSTLKLLQQHRFFLAAMQTCEVCNADSQPLNTPISQMLLFNHIYNSGQ